MNRTYAVPGSAAKFAHGPSTSGLRAALSAEPDRAGMTIAVAIVLLTVLGMTVALAFFTLLG